MSLKNRDLTSTATDEADSIKVPAVRLQTYEDTTAEISAQADRFTADQ